MIESSAARARNLVCIFQAARMDEEQQQHCCAEDIQCQIEEKTLYKDAYISITNQAITLNWYYFPTGTVKCIPFTNIKYVTTDEQLELGVMDYKTWGMGLNDIWWAWGSGRSPLFWDERKSNLIIETGSWVRKGCTVEDLGQVMKILNQHGVRTCHPEKKKDAKC